MMMRKYKIPTNPIQSAKNHIEERIRSLQKQIVNKLYQSSLNIDRDLAEKVIQKLIDNQDTTEQKIIALLDLLNDIEEFAEDKSINLFRKIGHFIAEEKRQEHEEVDFERQHIEFQKKCYLDDVKRRFRLEDEKKDIQMLEEQLKNKEKQYQIFKASIKEAEKQKKSQKQNADSSFFSNTFQKYSKTYSKPVLTSISSRENEEVSKFQKQNFLQRQKKSEEKDIFSFRSNKNLDNLFAKNKQKLTKESTKIQYEETRINCDYDGQSETYKFLFEAERPRMNNQALDIKQQKRMFFETNLSKQKKKQICKNIEKRIKLSTCVVSAVEYSSLNDNVNHLEKKYHLEIIGRKNLQNAILNALNQEQKKYWK